MLVIRFAAERNPWFQVLSFPFCVSCDAEASISPDSAFYDNTCPDVASRAAGIEKSEMEMR